MTPFWKIRREALRIWRQITYLPMNPLEQAWFRLCPLLFPDAYRVHPGGKAAAADTAVFLVHQPGGTQATVAATCRHLVGQGFAVHLVANGGLPRDDVERLLPLCARIFERPNHGYDFGGYQAAILTLLSEGARPGRLLLLNDSIWFPAQRDCGLLEELRALGTDVSGLVHYTHRTPYRSHIQSYLIAFSARAAQSRAFRQFWQDYAMSNNRVRTIRNGEMRLTEALRAAGFTVAARHEAYEVADLDGLSLAEAAAVRAYDSRRDQKILASVGSHRRVGYILSNHPSVNFRVLQFPILKKDGGGDYRMQRRALMAPEAADLRARLTPEVLAEVAARDGR